MLTKTSDSTGNTLRIGVVFTPLDWGEFAIEKFGIFRRWMDGATIFDPTMGSGNLLEALISHGLKQGHKLTELPIKQLFGNELNTVFYQEALTKFKESYGADMSENFWNKDILDLSVSRFDILFGNPPWANFTDLPAEYKERVKSAFFKYDLVEKSQSLLLGGSRIDISALVIQKAIKDFLKDSGDAFMFMPLSLLLNDGANQHFRTYKIHDVNYAITEVYDFNEADVFNGISTRYGLVHFKRDVKASFPVPYERFENNEWSTYFAKPLLHQTDPLSVLSDGTIGPLDHFEPISVSKESAPRQGINTCGANSIFFFKECEEMDASFCKLNSEHILPTDFIFPLLTSKNFKGEELTAYKWVLLPYNKNGKPLDLKDLEKHPELHNYLLGFKKELESRKGSMIGAWMKRGYWWALLGVGAYNFKPFKIVWEAYGKKTFNPVIVDGRWQANQSLQAFIPVETLEEANRILSELQNPAIEDYLLSLKMEGTMNWAQPGKIKKLLRYKTTDPTLF